MEKRIDFTNGKIVAPLLKFAGPVLFALFLQAMYGAVDLMIVGQYATAEDVSAVSTGSQIMMTFTNLMSSLCMGMTILLGQKIGAKKADEGGKIVGSGLVLFLIVALIMTGVLTIFAPQISTTMHAPANAYDLTVSYIRICGGGMIVIIAYNLIGGIFRGIGDSNTPLITVLIACICNIIGDLVLVKYYGLGTKGAAIATVAAQLVSVLISLVLISKKTLPFEFNRKKIKWDSRIIGKILLLGVPVALQDLLVGISFLVILALVNSLGVTESAGVGVAEKVCAFIMLVPLAFMQSMSAFVAQNRGARKIDRAEKGFKSSIMISLSIGVVMFYVSFFHGDLLAKIFSKDAPIIGAAADYLRAYAIDCILTCFLFCFIGFFNGMGNTTFVMLQGILGAFAVRVPVSIFMSKWEPVKLFHIGLATPCSTMLQIILCFGFFFLTKKSRKKLMEEYVEK